MIGLRGRVGHMIQCSRSKIESGNQLNVSVGVWCFWKS